MRGKAFDKLDRLFGAKPRFTPKPKPTPPASGFQGRSPPDEYTVESPKEAALRKAREAQERRWRQYLDKRAARLKALTASHAGAARYIRALHTLAERNAVTVYTRRDVDVDLAELATRCNLDTIPDGYGRFLLVEYTTAWITTLPGGKRRGIDDVDALPLDGRDPETIDDLKKVLRVH